MADTDDAQVMQLIADLPADARLAWAAGGHFSLREPFRTGWVDVYCADICEPAGWNWGWTVEQADVAVGEDRPFTVSAAFDAQLEMLLDDPGRPGVPLRARLRVDDGRVLDLGYLLDDDEWADYRDNGGDDWEWQRDMYWAGFQHLQGCTIGGVQYPPPATLTVSDGAPWTVCRVWTPAAVSAALQDWCAQHGRPDLRFWWDPQIRTPKDDLLDAAARGLRSLQAGESEAFTIGEGVKALAPALDFLLGLPADQAAQVTSALQSLQRSAAADEDVRLQAWLDALTDEGREAWLAGDLQPPAHVTGP
jgi:hypothetical protein